MIRAAARVHRATTITALAAVPFVGWMVARSLWSAFA